MRKLIPHIFFYLAIALMVLVTLNSCGTKKQVLHTISEKKVDSVYIKSTSIVSPQILSSLVINEVCDSTGKAKEFKQVFVVRKDTIKVEVKDNSLFLDFNRLEAITLKQDSVIKVRETQIKELKETNTTKTRINWKLLLILISIPVLFIIFPNIPKFINTLFKRLI